ncbi:MAG TPA: hypothetical protein VHC69_25460 [Polyangiaceae bacterium]|nr:hypothetical protein [Polyangiaceae bacterium]
MRRWASLGATLLLVFRAEAAAAAPALRSLHDTIHVTPGATCIDDEALREQVRSWLDADAVEGDLRVEVEGSSRDERFVSFRMWRGAALLAERRFAPGPADCAQLHAVLGLAIALALKVSLRDELFGGPSPRSSGAWSLGAAASTEWNVVPGVAGGAVVWLERTLPEPFALHVGLSAVAGGGAKFEHVSGDFTTASVALEAAACAVPSFGTAVRGRLCSGLEARALFASGNGFSVSKDAVLDWFSISNSLGVSVAIAQKWSLVGVVGLVVPLQRVQIAVVDTSGRVVETRDLAPAGGVLSLGGAYEF